MNSKGIRLKIKRGKLGKKKKEKMEHTRDGGTWVKSKNNVKAIGMRAIMGKINKIEMTDY